MSKCYECRKEIEKGAFRCDECLNKITNPKLKRTRGKTEWEEMKLGWYRDEKKWLDNISRRKNVYENGKQITVLTDHKGNIKRKMPIPPPPQSKPGQINIQRQ